MKLIALSIAGVVAASALTPVPAMAQRWHDGRGWHGGRYYHHGRWYNPPRWRGRGWRGRGYRTVCRGGYGHVRRCYRVRY